MNYTLNEIIKITVGFVIAFGTIACSAASHDTASTPTQASLTSDTNIVSEVKTTVNGQAATVLADSSGMTLYTFEQDTANTSNCRSSCLAEWPPMHVPAGTTVTAPFGVITGNDGQAQLTFSSHPLYRFSGDRQSGNTFGEYSGWDAVVVN